MKDETAIILVAILALTVLEISALLMEINGQLFSFICILIAGLAGYKIKDFFPQGLLTYVRERKGK